MVSMYTLSVFSVCMSAINYMQANDEAHKAVLGDMIPLVALPLEGNEDDAADFHERFFGYQ